MHAAHAECFVQLKGRLQEAPHGERGAIVVDVATALCCTPATIYRKLQKVGWDSGRKTRTDKGSLCVDENLAMQAAGMVKIGTRANGKKTMPLTTALNILEKNGMGIINTATGEVTMPCPTTVARAMMAYGCHPEQVRQGSPAQDLRSLHPNHVWEMDASVCVIFYLPKGKVEVLDEKKYYKNKPEHLKKIELQRVIRWVITDHYSGSLFVRYTQGSEDAASAIGVLIEAMCKRDGEQMHGVPFILYTDKGSPFVAALSQTFFASLRIHHITHTAGNARATGQVENAQNLVETQFEGRLRLLEITSLEELNAQAAQWRTAFNARAIHRRHKNTRERMWLRIKPEELRVPESVEALRAIVSSPSVEHTVKPTLMLNYTPKGFTAQRYSLRHIDGIVIGEKIEVCVNPYEAPAVDITVTGRDGTRNTYTLKPIDYDDAGFNAQAPVIGQEYKALADTATDKAIKAMDKAAYSADTLEAVEQAKKRKQRAYTDIDAMADVQATSVPTYFPKRGTAIQLDRQRELAPLSPVQAAMQIRPLLAAAGIHWTAEHLAALREAYGESVPAEAVQEFAAGIIAGVAASVTREQPTPAPMLLIAGGAA